MGDGTGYGIVDPDTGAFITKLEGDGDVKLGDSSGDLIQITGSVEINENLFFLTNGRVGINTDDPAYKLGVAGNVGINEYIYHNGDADTFIRLQPDDINIQAGGVDFIKITEDASQDMLVINEGGADVDLRVETQHNDHMFYINGSASRIGIGSSSPQHTLDIQERDGVEATIRLMGTADVGIRLAADSDNSGENDNPYIDWYQDGQNSNSRINRLASIAMEGDAGVTFTGSLGNGFFLDAYCPGALGGSNRTIQFANDSSNNGHAARITIEGTNGYVGIHTTTPSVTLDVNGSVHCQGQFARGVAAKDLGSGTTSTITPSSLGAGTVLITASSVTTPTEGPTEMMHICTIADGTTAGELLTLVLVTNALDGSAGLASMGMILFSPTNPLNSGEITTVTGEAAGGVSPIGSTAQYIWTGSKWARLSMNGSAA